MLRGDRKIRGQGASASPGSQRSPDDFACRVLRTQQCVNRGLPRITALRRSSVSAIFQVRPEEEERDGERAAKEDRVRHDAVPKEVGNGNLGKGQSAETD